MREFDRHLFAERLKDLRQEKGIGQNALAKELNLSNASISYWETAKQVPSADVIFKLSVYFDISSDYLIGLKDE